MCACGISFGTVDSGGEHQLAIRVLGYHTYIYLSSTQNWAVDYEIGKEKAPELECPELSFPRPDALRQIGLEGNVEVTVEAGLPRLVRKAVVQHVAVDLFLRLETSAGHLHAALARDANGLLGRYLGTGAVHECDAGRWYCQGRGRGKGEDRKGSQKKC